MDFEQFKCQTHRCLFEIVTRMDGSKATGCPVCEAEKRQKLSLAALDKLKEGR